MIQPPEALAEFMMATEASLDPRLWVKLMKEEIDEFHEAHLIFVDSRDKTGRFDEYKAADLLKEAADVMYVSTSFHMLMENGENLYRFVVPEEEWTNWHLTAVEANNVMKMASAIFGTYLLGVAFERVHSSNMSKLGDDGKPVRRKIDGKILKGPNYEPPVLTDLVENMNN